jgi:hypothetical protein
MSLRDELEFWGLPVPAKASVDEWATKLGDKPCQNALILVGLSALLFYRFEKGKNPKIKDIFDALVYTSTCVSVGYGDIFARTPMGKLLGSALMTIGPSIAAKTIDGRPDRQEDVMGEILRTLQQILDRLPGAREMDR